MKEKQRRIEAEQIREKEYQRLVEKENRLKNRSADEANNEALKHFM